MNRPLLLGGVAWLAATLSTTPRARSAEPPAIATDALTPVAAPGVRLSGYIQADGLAYDQASQDEVDPSTGMPLNQARYFVRRARLHLDVDHGHMAGSLELDANTVNGPSAGVIDAEVTARARGRDDTGRIWGEASVGLLRIPWGHEISEPDQDRFFLERSSVSRALFPGTFDLGLRARFGWRFFDAQIALMNGDPLGDHTFPAQEPNSAKDLVGRLGVSGARGRVRFAAGLSGLAGRGFHRGTPETKDVLVWRDQNEDGIVQLSEIQVISGSAATPSQNFRRFGLGGDARVTIVLPRLGTLDLFGELMWASNLDRALVPADPVAAGRDLREHGFVVGVVQQVGKWFAVGGRYDTYNPDADASQQRALAVVPVDATFATWTATAAWRWTALDRIVVEYQHVTNPLGRSVSGAPTTLGGNTLALRGQLAW
ncbi:MAG TPA: hypothetical protein VGP07_18345 [Polyangia bacterium]|jgi:hypothetical protein